MSEGVFKSEKKKSSAASRKALKVAPGIATPFTTAAPLAL